MDQRYAESICQELLPSNRSNRSSGIMLAFLRRVNDHLRDGTPLAFPAAVAEAFVKDPDVNDNDVCRECDYKLPRGCFTLCPVCGRGSVCSSYVRSAEKNLLAEKNALMTPK